MADIEITQGDVLRATATFLTDGVDVTQWVWTSEAVTTGIEDTDTIAQAFFSTLETAWQAAENIILDQIQGSVLELALYDLGADKWNTFVQISIASLVGTDTGSYLPLGVALLTKMVSTRAKALGKKFMFGINENHIEDGQFDAGAVANGLAFIALFIQPVQAVSLFFQTGAFNQDINDFNVFTGDVFADSNASYQRRRKPTVGL